MNNFNYEEKLKGMSEEELLNYLEKTKWKRNLITILQDWRLYVMLLPMVVFFVLWRYAPMFGLLIAFKNYNVQLGAIGSDFSGLYYFMVLMFGPDSSDFWQAFRNTFLLSFYGLVFGFPFPILLALLFSEIKNEAYRSIVQVISYLPKFVSTVVITTLTLLLIRTSSGDTVEAGILTRLLISIGAVPYGSDIQYLPQYFRPVYIISDIWEGAGYGSIVYFAAIVGISPTNYEAARIDGANKLAQIRYVTLPGILSTLTIMLILRIGNLLQIGYEKVLLLYNFRVYSTADVISTYVYRIGIVSGSTSQGSAADFFNAIIAMLLVIGANAISKRVSNTSLY